MHYMKKKGYIGLSEFNHFSKAAVNLEQNRKNPISDRLIPDGSSSSENSTDNKIKLKSTIHQLKKELAEAQHLISLLLNDKLKMSPIIKSFLETEMLIPEPDYPEATEYQYYSSDAEISGTIERYSQLFAIDRLEIMNMFNQLPEFEGSEELQLKIFLTVIVLTYRSVQESIRRHRLRVIEVLGISTNGTFENKLLDIAICQCLYRKAKSECGLENAKEVTSQIWTALFDFPTLKTCTRFNRFILDCVSVVWDMVTGIDGKLPRMEIEFGKHHYDPILHQRSFSSNQQSKYIKKYLWPALINSQTNECLCKAIVIT